MSTRSTIRSFVASSRRSKGATPTIRPITTPHYWLDQPASSSLIVATQTSLRGTSEPSRADFFSSLLPLLTQPSFRVQKCIVPQRVPSVLYARRGHLTALFSPKITFFDIWLSIISPTRNLTPAATPMGSSMLTCFQHYDLCDVSRSH